MNGVLFNEDFDGEHIRLRSILPKVTFVHDTKKMC